MAKFKKVASLLEKKRKISKEIENLQNKCTHLRKSVRSTKEREDASTFVIRWVCDECERITGVPNEQEINKYLMRKWTRKSREMIDPATKPKKRKQIFKWWWRILEYLFRWFGNKCPINIL